MSLDAAQAQESTQQDTAQCKTHTHTNTQRDHKRAETSQAIGDETRFSVGMFPNTELEGRNGFYSD